jgi:hypothetical protein
MEGGGIKNPAEMGKLLKSVLRQADWYCIC